jgi:hypothetical protein
VVCQFRLLLPDLNIKAKPGRSAFRS